MEKFIRTVLRGLECSNALRLPDGNIPTSDKPTSRELWAFACFVSEYVKEGDRIMVFRSRIKGTANGKPRTWEDKEKVVRAASLELVVFELAITQARADRPARTQSMPASEDVSE